MTTTKNGGSNSGHHHHHHHHHHRQHHASANLHSTPAVTSVNNVGVPVGAAGTVPILQHGSCISVVGNLNGPSALATCSSSTSPTSISTSVSICNRLNESQRGSNETPDADVILALLARNKALQATIPKCAGCEQAIFDRFILKVLDRPWHAKCLKCAECGVQLADKCYVRSGQLFCKDDFFKRFGTKCAGCEQGIPPTQIVRRAHENVYHLHCFICVICTRQLNTGDEFYLMEDNKLVCKHDYEAAKARAGDSEGGNKRPRTTISAKQLETLKTAYSNSPKPARHVREQLSQDTGLDMRVVQVWFQNRRAKEKRLKKDAGRTRWGQYFRNMKQTRRDKRRSDDHSSVDGDKDQSFQDDFSDDVINSDLGSNSDSYGHGGPMTSLDQESYPAGPHLPSASFLPGGPGHFNGLHSTAPGLSTPPTLPGSRSPIPPHTPLTPVFNYTESGVVGFTPSSGVGSNGPSNGQLPLSIPRLISNISGPGSDVSNTSSNQGYPEFPPSPESWLDDVENSAHAQQY